jgi:hypothetical protein
LGSLTFAFLTGAAVAFSINPEMVMDTPDHPWGNPFALVYFAPVFTLGLMASLALDRPKTRTAHVSVAVGWHLMLVIYLSCWIISGLRRLHG